MAQVYVNQKNINTANYQYIEAWGKYNRASDKFFVMVDYGQDVESDSQNTHLKMHNGTGEILQFNSIVAILNFLYVNGWELVTLKNNNEVESYILKKRKDFSLPISGKDASTTSGSN
jgi:hypothetical protein